jgi:hypothetical protein
MNIRELKKQAFEAGQRDYWLERFAELVAAHEREECAKLCDVTPPYPFRPSIEAAHAIRARGES